ncbi:MAG: alpha/beta hydrolase [Acidimicrobiales bacterium]|nr:alpha/beta hydrolase [Acidimicrobiales bacterium]MDP6298926.1 alpha/beta hydrolase [Acidimicrobiales bacterium]HJM27885.1 alpha/beta hydrolase [Acidimicrobiales bacterium]HJM98444.1 alpha/beta hydrolase [Acidimicrobiales bacterium]
MRTVLLVHGAWHGSWCWDLVVNRLESSGIEVATIDLPFTGLENDSVAVSEAIESIGGQIIVLGHSYGGMVISKAAEGKNEVSHLVYLCAILLNQGETMVGDTVTPHPSKIQINVDENLGSTVKKDAIIPAFYEDVPREIAEESITKLRSFPIGSVSSGVGEAWKEKETTYVICKNDSAIHPDRQREMSALADSVIEWDCAHSPFFSDPDLVCDLLVNLANAT